MESSDFDPSLMSTESSVGKPESSQMMGMMHIGAAALALGLVGWQCRNSFTDLNEVVKCFQKKQIVLVLLLAAVVLWVIKAPMFLQHLVLLAAIALPAFEIIVEMYPELAEHLGLTKIAAKLKGLNINLNP